MKALVYLTLSLLWSVPAAGQGTDFVFTPETLERSGPPGQTLQQALRLYERRDFHAASILLQRVAAGETGDAPAHVQRAQLWLGKALFHLKLYTAALSAFDRVLEQGEKQRYLDATLSWLVALSRQLPETSGILSRIGLFADRVDLERPALAPLRDELCYLLGRHHYMKGELERAAQRFAAVSKDSPLHLKASYMEGVTRARQDRGSEALQAFFRVERARDGGDEARRLGEMAMIAAARVLFAMGRYDRSLDLYGRVPRGSRRWLTALFESGWTRFHQDRFGRALGDLHTLAAPYFEEHFFPEAHILQAVVYWRHCRWQRSREALEAFNRRYPPLKREIDRLLARQRDPEELFEHARRQLAGAAGATEVDRLVAQALGDRDLARYFDQVRVVERELGRVKAADAAWRATELGGAVLQDLAVQLALCRSEAGRQTRRRLGRIAKEIQSLTQQAIKVEYETILAQKDQLRGELRGYLVPPDRAGSPEVDDEHELWPFEGPYWRDELGAYHVRVGSQCPARRGGSAGLWHPLASRAVRDTPLEVSF